jgi:hypothetical protein
MNDDLWCEYSGMPSPMAYVRCNKCKEFVNECKCMINEENKIQELEGEVFELEFALKDHRDKERIYQEILSDINNSIIDLFKKEQENIRFNFGEEIDYRQCIIGMKEYLDNIKSLYRGKINF